MYSRGILEKGEKPHLQSAEPYKHRQLGRTVPQTEQSRRHSRAPRCSKMGTVQSHFSLIPLCQQGDKGKAPIFTEKPKSPSYTKHLNRHARLALLFTAVQTHLFLHLTHTRTWTKYKARLRSAPRALSAHSLAKAPLDTPLQSQAGMEPQRESGHTVSHSPVKESLTHSWWRDLDGGADVGAARGVMRSFLKSSLVSLDLQGREETETVIPQ